MIYKSKPILKKGVVDQILLWMVMFISFITILFLVLDYYKVIKTKDRVDTVTNYGVRMKALGKEDDDIVSGINNIKSDFFDTVAVGDLSCNDDDTTTGYQVTFTANITYNNMFLSEFESINSKASAFNEVSNHNIECTLILRTK